MSSREIFVAFVSLFLIVLVGVFASSIWSYLQSRNKNKLGLFDDLHKAIYTAIAIGVVVLTSVAFILLNQPTESEKSLEATEEYLRQTQDTLTTIQVAVGTNSGLLTPFPSLISDIAQKNRDLSATQTQIENNVKNNGFTETAQADTYASLLLTLTPIPTATLYTQEDLETALAQTHEAESNAKKS